MICPPDSDRSFGPQVNVYCRSMDFTVQFEDIVFASLPAALLLFVVPSYFVLLLRKPAIFPLRSKYLAAKCVSHTLSWFTKVGLKLTEISLHFPACSLLSWHSLLFVCSAACSGRVHPLPPIY